MKTAADARIRLKSLFLNTPRNRLVLSRLVLLGIVVLFCCNVYPSVVATFDFSALEYRYQKWMAEPGNLNWLISDSDLYAYVGGRYVKGVSPDEINFEHPPLAKYLIGMSILVFNNPNVTSALLGVASLLILYEISKRLLGRSMFALVPVYMLSLDRLFIDFSSMSMLDMYLAFFLLLSLLLISHPRSNSRLFAGMTALGLAAACKLTAILAIPSLAVQVIMTRRNVSWKLFALGASAAGLVYCLSYTWFFVLGHGLSEFLNLQWNMLMFQFGRRYGLPYPPGRLLLTFLTGIVGPETRNILYVDEVSKSITVVTTYGLAMAREFNPLTWPLCFSGTVMSLYESLKNRNVLRLQACILFFSFLIPFSFGQGFVWYLLPVIPIGFLLFTNVVKNIGEGMSVKRFLPALLIYLVALLVWSRLFAMPGFIKL